MRNTTIARRPGRITIPFVLFLVFCATSVLTTSCDGRGAGKYTTRENDGDVDYKLDSTATAIYQLYIDGRFAEYVNQVESNDSKPAKYREQMELLLKQRHAQQLEENGGPVSCRLLRFEPSGDNYGMAFLEVKFHNKSREVILQQMVKVDGRWRIR